MNIILIVDVCYVGGLSESTLMMAALDNDDVGPAAAADDDDADATVDLQPCVSTSSHIRMLSTSNCKSVSSAASEAQHLEISLTLELEADDTMDIMTHVDDGQMLYLKTILSMLFSVVFCYTNSDYCSLLDYCFPKVGKILSDVEDRGQYLPSLITYKTENETTSLSA